MLLYFKKYTKNRGPTPSEDDVSDLIIQEETDGIGSESTILNGWSCKATMYMIACIMSNSFGPPYQQWCFNHFGGILFFLKIGSLTLITWCCHSWIE